MSVFEFEGLGRPDVDLSLLDDLLEISEARLVEKARDVDEEISLAFVLEACLIPYRLSAMIPTV